MPEPPAARPAEPPVEAPTACSLCAEPIRSIFFRTGKMVFCPSCRAAAGAERGTRLSRSLRALAFGSLAALLSAVVWYAVIVWTDREFALLAIAVGLFVGAAVRWGAHRKGGWRYQALAMFLTYSAIVAAYVPIGLQAAFEDEDAMAATDSRAVTVAVLEAPDAATMEAADAVDRAPSTAAESDSEPRQDETIGPGGLVLGLAALLGLIYAAPFLAGFENVLGWLILGIALYEAWKLNRREELVFEGPLHLPGTRPTYVPEPAPPPISP